jgi:hypothetical protein
MNLFGLHQFPPSACVILNLIINLQKDEDLHYHMIPLRAPSRKVLQSQVTKHFNPQESFEHIQFMQHILDEVMRIRRAMIKQENPEHLRTFFINKDELHALRKFFTLSLTV